MNQKKIHKNSHEILFFDIAQSLQEQSLTFVIADHAHLELVLFFSGGNSSQHHINIQLQGEYAQAHVHVVYITQSSSQATVIINQNHEAPHTKSSVIMRVLGLDNSFCMYKGMIYIAEYARGSSAYQDHKALMLGNCARAVAHPMLEVLTNDVKCGHGSAIGVLDEQQIFYMQTRGLQLERARFLLLEYFCAQALVGMSNNMYKDNIQQKIHEILKV